MLKNTMSKKEVAEYIKCGDAAIKQIEAEHQPTKEKRFIIKREGIGDSNVKQIITYIQYVYGTATFKVSIMIRCPTQHWNYYVAFAISTHSDKPQAHLYNENVQQDCEFLPCGKCYGTGSSTHGDRLWDLFIESNCDEEVIWNELLKWYERNKV